MENKIVSFPITKGELVPQKIKTIEIGTLDTETIRNAPIEKEKHKRIVTSTKKWTFTEDDYTQKNQLELLQSLRAVIMDDTATKSPHQTCILQQINQKIAGYKNQDIVKNIYNPIAFITVDRVIQLLIDSNLQCHYCKKNVMVLYEIVREPLQWTLDRIDNDIGHNKGNLYISCLSCNLRRKTIYHEKYAFTKVCSNVIKLS
jgi:hypothetical protein